MDIPKDNFMLMSYLNTALRDSYPSLDELCSSLMLDSTEIEERMASIGMTYSAALNKFIQNII